MSKFDEPILVVPRDVLFNDEADAFNGFIGMNDRRYENIISTLPKFEVKRRGDMEEDPAYKQLVGYVIITSDNGKTLVYKRLNGGGEARLHGMLSIGVGGHMNDVPDASGIEEKLYINAGRELSEEVGLSQEQLEDIEIVGLINDDDNEVGRVHIGVVFKVTVEEADVASHEEDTLELIWEKDDQLAERSPYESWSELIIKDAYGR
ncbi:NUDIX domain-containing protein [Salinicoccus sp. RF5]|uniref:NUDIX domain-containing protein n=1 Tax=Salinicoccus sp. RF5 TaxID=2748874 RepID=UPI001E543E2E|nr:NUDIX domain-containing protein [Salinicoccus sp. RF5]MCC4721595.1 NUDIX domain-containing protein [Salinicoccus sp. RF5]